MTTASVPKPEMRGVGHVTYRCADCGQQLDEPWFSDGTWAAREIVDMSPAVRTYHKDHLPAGVNVDGR
jgi:hypothetical protein